MIMDPAKLEQDLIEWVTEWIDETEVEIEADTDLLGTGLLDSMGMVGMVVYLEDRADAEFDFSTFDPGESASIRGLIQHCLRA